MSEPVRRYPTVCYDCRTEIKPDQELEIAEGYYRHANGADCLSQGRCARCLRLFQGGDSVWFTRDVDGRVLAQHRDPESCKMKNYGKEDLKELFDSCEKHIDGTSSAYGVPPMAMAAGGTRKDTICIMWAVLKPAIGDTDTAFSVAKQMYDKFEEYDRK